MEESQMHYARLKRQYWEVYKLYDSTDFGKGNGIKIENRSVVGGRNWLQNSALGHFGSDGPVLYPDCGKVYILVFFLKTQRSILNYIICFNYTICTF